jgi:hypothetical protein
MHSKKNLFRIILTLSCLAPVLVYANTPAPELLAPKDENYRKPSEPIVLKFPFDIINNITTQLALEVDNIDVSLLVKIEGNVVIFTPTSPLLPGMHQLRMVEYADNGDIVELGNWQFEVRQSAAFQSQQLQVAASLNGSGIAASDYTPQDPEIDNYSSNGAAEINYQASNGDSGVQLHSTLIYDRVEENTTTGKSLDLGDFLLQVDVNKHSRLNVGHHAIEYASLIYRDFNRRGVSGSVTLPGINSSIQLFSAHSTDLYGFNGGLGVSDADNRSEGIVLSVQPFTQNPQALTLSTAYLSGAQSEADGELGFSVEESSGTAQSLAADSLLLDQRLRLYLEAAKSHYDYDGNHSPMDAITDSAYQFLAQYDALPSGSDADPWQWGLSVEKLIVEPDFRVLSNQQLGSDVDYSSISSNLNKGNWTSQVFFHKESDNLDHRFDATNHINTTGLELNYSGTREDATSVLDSWNYRGVYQLTRQQQDGVELGADGNTLPKNDSRTEFIQFTAEYGYPWGSWYLSLSRDELSDDSGQQQDSQAQGTELGGSINLNSDHLLSASFAYINSEELATHLDNQSITYHIGLESNFAAQAITSSLSADYQKTDDALYEDLTENQNQLSVNAVLGKTFRQPHGASPGVDLQLRASYFDLVNQLSDEDSSNFYEVFIDLNIYWNAQSPSASTQAAFTTEENWQ